MKVLFDIPKRAVSIDGNGPELIRLIEVVREVAPSLLLITINTEPSKQDVPEPKALWDATN